MPQLPDLRLHNLVQKMVEGGESEDDIAGVIQHYKSKPVSAEDFTDKPKEPEGSAVGRFFSGVGEMLNPVTMVKGIASAVAHPIDTGKQLLKNQGDTFDKAVEDVRGGRYSEAIGHGVSSLVPIVGPVIGSIGDQAATGDVAGAAGKTVGLLAPAAVAKAVPRTVTTKGLFKNANPQALEAVELAQRSGVPIDAGIATGNRFVKAVQHVSDRSLGGSMVAGKAQQAQAEGLATLGEQLAAKGSALPATAESAGEGVRSAVTNIVRKHAGEADKAYTKLREFESHPMHTKSVQVGTKADPTTGALVPVMEDMPLPVDVRSVKAATKDVYDSLKREAELVPLTGHKARALTTLDRLQNGPDHAPLSVADSALGELKTFARVDEPALRSIGQGVAAGAVKHLEAVVTKTAKDAGGQVYEALKSGRGSTVAKYEAADVLDALHEEPVRTINKLTAAKDASIDQLRAVAQIAPAEMPKIGRAVLDDLLSTATSEGGFGHAAALAAKWEKIGPATKQVLYRDPGYVADLDRFFRLAKMTAETPNPSGTAHTLLTAGQGGLLLTEPVTGAALQLGTAALSKLMHSKAGVKLLTKGLRIPAANKAAGAAWLADLASNGVTIPSGPQNRVAAPQR
jgi:hypothetical protein